MAVHVLGDVTLREGAQVLHMAGTPAVGAKAATAAGRVDYDCGTVRTAASSH
jgi:hypothetical protein